MTFGTALSSIGLNKLRAGLTLLGVVIGVSSVIALMSIGRGAQQQVTERIQGLGTDLLFVRPGATQQGGIFQALGSAATLTLSDAAALADPVYTPSVLRTAPQTQVGLQAAAQGKNAFTQALGVTTEYMEVRNLKLKYGRNISPADVQNRKEFVVLGSRISETLFGVRDPVGESVRLRGRKFMVIGVLQSRGGTAFGNEDDQVLVPITTAYYRLSGSRTSQGDVTVQTINVQAASGASLDSATAEISILLRVRHRIEPDAADDFTVTSQQETVATLNETTNTFVVFLGSIAGISLLVGGIGIMNIMLVSVTERTREIGIRRAVGAKRRDVLSQFLLEATLLSVGGGLLGLASGWGLSVLINGKNLGNQTFRTTISGDVMALALIVSAAIGLFFGIYPALRASRMDPIVALRHE
ncbi:MAG: FtsX-like permease family protein [Dehalococcoidia bacterium]|nr:FtsX-like permease family protein [Dehalococcoidia bacterium]